jgi:hypothetical protein
MQAAHAAAEREVASLKKDKALRVTAGFLQSMHALQLGLACLALH